MLLLKISYWIAFASAASWVILAMASGEVALLSPAITAFIGGSVIAGLDQIVTLLTPAKPEPAPSAEPTAPKQSETTMEELQVRMDRVRTSLAASRQPDTE